MSWISFFYWIFGLYALYYAGNLTWDLVRAKRTNTADKVPELHFEEAVSPQKVSAEPQKKSDPERSKGKADPIISAVGGVNLKDLFNLAKAEVIAYNRAVTFR